MNVNGINGAGMRPDILKTGTGNQTDPVSKDLQTQIEKLKNDLHEISASQDMSLDAKMKKRQEIQKQISELEIQLRQHQMEARREERQKKKEESSFDNLAGTKPQKKQGESQNMGMSAGNMEAMISADKAIKQASVNGSTAKKMESRANVLEVEIKLDTSRNGSSNVSLKEEELAKTKESMEKATASQIDSLVQAGKNIQDASKEDKTTGQKEEDKKISGTEEEKENLDIQDNEILEETGCVYHPVDVRL